MPPTLGPRRLPALARRALIVVVLALLAGAGGAAAVAALGTRIRPDPAPPARQSLIPPVGRTGSAGCTDPVGRRLWRVDWKITAGPGESTGAGLEEQAQATVIVPTALAVRSTGPTPSATGPTPSATGWSDQAAQTWALHWNPTLAQTLRAGAQETWVRTGPLATLATIPVTVGQSPRLTTPDGACTVFLAPFVSGEAGAKTVAVIGDSLVAQLYATQDGSLSGPGQLLARLTAGGHRAEINGQGGRRWTILPGSTPGIDQADQSMFDEIRGLRAADSMVIALGTNDAGWVALAGDDATYELRLAWVLLHLAPMIDELQRSGHCTVLATMATRDKRYLNSAPGRFDQAARRIDDYLRERVAADPHGRLRLWDWGAHADPHGTADPQPWFGPDTIHLLATGRNAYADELTRAAALCWF